MLELPGDPPSPGRPLPPAAQQVLLQTLAGVEAQLAARTGEGRGHPGAGRRQGCEGQLGERGQGAPFLGLQKHALASPGPLPGAPCPC